MNARIKTVNLLNSKSRQELDKYIFDKAMEIYKEESAGLVRRCYKTICVALNEKFGFGRNRIIRLIDSTKEISNLRHIDEIYWKHMDDVLIKQIGLEFEREEYDYLEGL